VSAKSSPSESGHDEVRVRELTAADASKVAPLLAQLGYPADDPAARERIEAWSASDHAGVFGAELAGELVGCVAVYVVPFFERAGARARLVALVVDTHRRGCGIGSALVQRARAFAVDRGAVELEVTSRVEREEAHRFYRGCGFDDVTGRSRRYISRLGSAAGCA